MFGGAIQRRRVVIASVLAAVAIGAVVLTQGPSAPAEVGAPTAPRRVARLSPAPAPACRFTPGESVAFHISSALTAGDIEDRFEASMSWKVVAANADSARVRAALSQVVLTQQLAQPGQETASPEGVAFYLDVAADCSLRGAAYAPQWDVGTRVLVQTQLDNLAFALPTTPAPTWRTPGSDGVGSYTADFRLTGESPWTIERRKVAHAARGDGASMGVEVRIEGARAVATFEHEDARWWRSIRGQEAVVIDAEGSPPVTLRQRFSLVRDDALFEPVPTLDPARADGRSPHEMPLRSATPQTRFASYAEAWGAFADAVNDGREHDAAQELAAWLRAHPADVARLVTRLRANQDATQHAALFLALELSRTDEARDALMTLIDAEELSGLDQARAASALSDLGPPTPQVAARLLERANADDMAARVSLLGVGTMTGRADDPALREGMISALSTTLAAADSGMVNTVLDAMGNSGDAAFADAIGDALSAESTATRRHAAQALARLPGEVAAPRLLDQLGVEGSPRVAADLVKALGATGQRSAEARALLAERLDRADAEERIAVIDWLGAGGERESQRILVAQFHREPSPRLKQQIGRYLPAAALR